MRRPRSPPRRASVTEPVAAPSKQAVESFSFVEDASLRMVPALAAQPEPDPDDSSTVAVAVPDPSSVTSPRTSTPSPPGSSTRSSHRSSLAQSAAVMASQHSQPLGKLPATAATAAKVFPAQASPLSPSLPTQQPPLGDDGGRSSSKSRRRLTHSLGSLLKGKRKSDDQGAVAPVLSGSSASAGGGGGDAATPSTTGRRSSNASRRQSMEDGTAARPAPAVVQPTSPSSPSAPFDPSSSTSSSSSTPRSHKPPVSLPHIFRRRQSGSTPDASGSSSLADLHHPSSSGTGSPATGEGRTIARRSLDGTRVGSNSSRGSSALVEGSEGEHSLVSTAPTSPDRAAFAPSGQSPSPGDLTMEEKRRRGSDALARELSDGIREEGQEDLADFVAASGSSTASPRSSSAPFSPLASSFHSGAPSLSQPVISPTTGASSSYIGAVEASSVQPSLAARRGHSPNVEGLHLSDLRPSSPFALPASSIPAVAAPGATASPPTSSPEGTDEVATSFQPRASTRTRLGALPRLLSSAAVSTQASNRTGEEEQEPYEEESETDTEADESSEEDEGEHYRPNDEGPVTTRSRDVTPAQTPLPLTPRGRPVALGGQTGRTSRMPSLTGLSMAPAAAGSAAGPSGWVAFAPSTPTPSIRTTRPNLHIQTNGTSTPSAPSASTAVAAPYSYFDIPRPIATASNAASPTTRTPGLSSLVPPQTPLAPMSLSDVARGKRPAWQEEVDASASAAPFSAVVEEEDAGAGAGAGAGAAAVEGEEGDKAVRAGLYRMRSHSVVALASPSMIDDGAAGDNHPVGTAALTGLDPVWQSGGAGVRTPGPSFLNLSDLATKVQTSPPGSQPISPVVTAPKTPLPLAAPFDPRLPPPGSPASISNSFVQQPSQPVSPTRASRPPTAASTGPYRNALNRRRSMFELHTAPPAYAHVYRRPGFAAPQIIEPRDDEGNEGLPGYTCSIHIEGYMPRKMEFTAPGVQAKDRAWKRQYVVLHGTSIKVYKFDLRTHPIPGEEDWSVVPKDIAGHDGPPPLHFHEGEYGVDAASTGGGGAAAALHHKFPLSIGDAKAKAKSRILEGSAAAAQNQLLRHYSLQNAESGLAADYLKRKHVVRVRAEGEQFLLQARDDRGVIDLIEALQAATNVALDLDARPLPKFITLPRRRRRRRPRVDANGNPIPATAAAGATGSAAPDTATGGGAGGGGGRADRMGDMLAEEQNAYAARTSGTVM
ncbi:hypothetical protein JCM11251_001547 [Rhodosporidiobolus azoricus]